MIASNPLIKKDKRSKKKRQRDFLDKFMELLSVSAAADAANVGRRTVYDWLKYDLYFRDDYNDAQSVVAFLAEDELIQRVLHGTIKHTVYRDKVVGEVKMYSDKLLMELLRARIPHHYGKNADPANAARPRFKISDEELRQINRAFSAEIKEP